MLTATEFTPSAPTAEDYALASSLLHTVEFMRTAAAQANDDAARAGREGNEISARGYCVIRDRNLQEAQDIVDEIQRMLTWR